MVPDRQKVWTDGMDGQTDGHTDDAKTISLRLRRGMMNNAVMCTLNLCDVIRITRHLHTKLKSFFQPCPTSTFIVHFCIPSFMSEAFFVDVSI